MLLYRRCATFFCSFIAPKTIAIMDNSKNNHVAPLANLKRFGRVWMAILGLTVKNF
jgi:hypothetical protein|tara:strand:+ start:363 stop:530 length:168 start_codon:yes stop_codon:yes gene_type:complete